MKKPVINEANCIGCGTCNACAANTFSVPNPVAHVVNPTGDSEEMINTAMASCPTSSISWVEES